MKVHPYDSNSKFYNFLFHPLHNKETKGAAIITNIFLSVATLFTWQIAFWVVNRRDNAELNKLKKRMSVGSGGGSSEKVTFSASNAGIGGSSRVSPGAGAPAAAARARAPAAAGAAAAAAAGAGAGAAAGGVAGRREPRRARVAEQARTASEPYQQLFDLINFQNVNLGDKEGIGCKIGTSKTGKYIEGTFENGRKFHIDLFPGKPPTIKNGHYPAIDHDSERTLDPDQDGELISNLLNNISKGVSMYDLHAARLNSIADGEHNGYKIGKSKTGRYIEGTFENGQEFHIDLFPDEPPTIKNGHYPAIDHDSKRTLDLYDLMKISLTFFPPEAGAGAAAAAAAAGAGAAAAAAAAAGAGAGAAAKTVAQKAAIAAGAKFIDGEVVENRHQELSATAYNWKQAYGPGGSTKKFSYSGNQQEEIERFASQAEYAVIACRGEFSNFYRHDIEFPLTNPASTLKCAEQAFQALKFPPGPKRDQILQQTNPGAALAEAGRLFNPKNLDAWNGVKFEVMIYVQLLKAQTDPNFKNHLLDTGTAFIIEDTSIRKGGEPFWGDNGDGTGLNLLGLAQMTAREIIQKNKGAVGEGLLSNFYRDNLEVQLVAYYAGYIN